MIKSLNITNFRQFSNISFDIQKEIVVIVGDNTKGKSTILESIYILTNGETPWGSIEDEFKQEQNDEEKYVRLECRNGESKSFTYFRDSKKRQLKIDGRNTQPKKFFENISSVLFSPEQIELLMISGTKRREFLDKLICDIDFEYADALSKAHKVLKQRNALLKKLAKHLYESGVFKIDDSQLIYWTKTYALLCEYIMKKREEIISKMRNEYFYVEYKPSVVFNYFENLSKEENIKEIIYEKIMEKAKRDIAVGYTNIGIHRDDFLIFADKDVKRFGSRGEKRLAVGRLIFQTLEIKNEYKGSRPILLLDDIPSELDKGNSLNILSDEIINKQQTFITTLDLGYIPKSVLKKAQIIDLNTL